MLVPYAIFSVTTYWLWYWINNQFIEDTTDSHIVSCMGSVIGSGCQDYSGYPQTSNMSRTLVGNKIVDHSDVVRASPLGAAPTTSSFST